MLLHLETVDGNMASSRRLHVIGDIPATFRNAEGSLGGSSLASHALVTKALHFFNCALRFNLASAVVRRDGETAAVVGKVGAAWHRAGLSWKFRPSFAGRIEPAYAHLRAAVKWKQSTADVAGRYKQTLCSDPEFT